MGWSAGSRSSPHFDWVRNITANLSKAEIEASNKDASSLFALTWQMMRNIIPPEVVADVDEFVAASGIPRMNGNGQLPEGVYEVLIGGVTFPFHKVELAPPGGVIGQNYSRWAVLSLIALRHLN